MTRSFHPPTIRQLFYGAGRFPIASSLLICSLPGVGCIMHPWYGVYSSSFLLGDSACHYAWEKKKGLFLTNFTFLDRSNFLGTKFTVYDAQPPHAGASVARSRSTRLVGLKQVSPRVPAGNYPVIQIAYELNVLGSRWEKVSVTSQFTIAYELKV